MIVSLHVATGAAAGALTRSHRAALVLGPLLHYAGDRMPHHDLYPRSFEIRSGLACLAAIAAVRGPRDPAVTGALSSSAPDVEHLVPFLRFRGQKLFPTHRGDHPPHGVPTWAQLLAAGAIVGVLVSTRTRAGAR